jgi:hypothetical protein
LLALRSQPAGFLGLGGRSALDGEPATRVRFANSFTDMNRI